MTYPKNNVLTLRRPFHLVPAAAPAPACIPFSAFHAVLIAGAGLGLALTVWIAS